MSYSAVNKPSVKAAFVPNRRRRVSVIASKAAVGIHLSFPNRQPPHQNQNLHGVVVSTASLENPHVKTAFLPQCSRRLCVITSAVVVGKFFLTLPRRQCYCVSSCMQSSPSVSTAFPSPHLPRKHYGICKRLLQDINGLRSLFPPATTKHLAHSCNCIQ